MGGMEAAHPHRLVYTSSAFGPFDQATLDEIVEVARRRNGADGITGMLLYHDGNILQVLEGPRENVIACYDRIEKDPRHHGCIVLQSEGVAGRTFAQWEMAYVPFGDLDAGGRDGFFDLQNLRHTEEFGIAGDDPKTRIFVERFMDCFSDLTLA